jgi:iron complex outermembrane receptor protein
MKPLPLPRTLRAVCLLGLATVLHAQSAVGPSSTPTSPPPPGRPNVTHQGDDVVTLSEFNVSAASDQGYVSSESMTGTRVAMQIRNLPFNVNILTSEFFEDFAMFELGENLAYISSFNGLDQGGGYNLRGFNQSYQLRDGFFRLGRYGTSNVDRIEVIKGPNAAIYGQSQPGGMINMISKRPKTTERQKLSYSHGSYRTHRFTGESTGPLPITPNTYYIVDLGFYERRYDRPFSALRNREAYGAVHHKFSDNTSLLVTAEYFLRMQHSPLNPIPYRFDPTYRDPQATAGRYTGIATELANFNQNGPQAEQNRGIVFVSGIFESKFNDTWSLRLGTNYGHAHNWNFANTNSTQFFTAASGTTPANSLSRGLPSKGLIDEVTLNIQADLLAHWYLWNKRVENRDLFTFDFADYYRFDPTWQLRSGVPRGTTTIIVGQPVDFFVPPYDTINYVSGVGVPGSTTGRWRKNRASVWGDLYRHQSAFMQGRLLTYASVRYDEVKLRLRNYVGAPVGQPATLKDNLQNWSPSAGVLYKLTPNISPYVNYSTGFNPLVQNQDARTPLPAEKAWGYDFGVKTSFLEDRLTLTLGGFYIVRKNVVVTELDPLGNTFNVPEGNHLVRGQELEFNYRWSDRLSTGLSWGHIDSRITNEGRNFMSVGRSPARIPPQNGGAYARYAFTTGRLKGLSANLGVVYTGPFHPESGSAGDVYTFNAATGTTTYTTNYQWALTVPSSTIWNGGLRYTFRPNGSRLSHTIGVNVNNITNHFYISTARTAGDLRSAYVTYTLNVAGSGR